MLNDMIAISKLRLTLVVAALISMPSCMISESYNDANTKAREESLVKALKYTRDAIRDYTQDYGKPPQQLQDLVAAGYFNHVPIDPMTNKADWTVTLHECETSTPCEKRIRDVHSSSTEKSSKNTPYSEW